MDTPGITYAFLIIPSLFAGVVLLQGIDKLIKNNKEGYVITGLGVLFFLMIAAAYYFFIR